MKELEEILAKTKVARVDLERTLGLPFGYLKKKKNLNLPETKALLKIINAFPFMLTVAAGGYKKEIAEKALKDFAKSLTVWGDPMGKDNIIL